MKIVTYNLNGVRAACNKGLNDWIQNSGVDIFCFQETRATEEQIKSVLDTTGYHAYFNVAERKGYSGTGVLTKKEPLEVMTFLPSVKDDNEGRLLLIKYEGFSILDYYTPNGGSRLDFKFEFMNNVLNDIRAIIKDDELIICTDFNIAHTEQDVSNPKACRNRTGFLPEECKLFDEYLKAGLNDCYRRLHPQGEAYTWSSYSAKATGNKAGWLYRFDYIFASDSIADRLIKCDNLLDKDYSDHYPVLAEFNIRL